MRRARPLLGTYVEIEAGGPKSAATESAINAAFAAVEFVQRLMSFHEAGSELSRLNRQALFEPIPVHPWTAKVLRQALSIHHATDGLFDCAVGHELLHWQLLPPDRSLGSVRSGSLKAIRVLSGNRVAYTAKIALDLGGIAKGFAVDCAIAVLRRHGIRHAAVNAGGDLRVIGNDEHPIYLRNPLDPRQISLAGTLRDGAIATSSAAATLKTWRGRSVSALVAKDRKPITDCASYSVIAKTCLIADALTKVLAQVRQTDSPYLEWFGAKAVIVEARVAEPRRA